MMRRKGVRQQGWHGGMAPFPRYGPGCIGFLVGRVTSIAREPLDRLGRDSSMPARARARTWVHMQRGSRRQYGHAHRFHSQQDGLTGQGSHQTALLFLFWLHSFGNRLWKNGMFVPRATSACDPGGPSSLRTLLFTDILTVANIRLSGSVKVLMKGGSDALASIAVDRLLNETLEHQFRGLVPPPATCTKMSRGSMWKPWCPASIVSTSISR